MPQNDWIVDIPISKNWPVYTRGNVGEVFPEAVSPLGWNLAGLEAERAWRRSFIDLGVHSEADYASEGDFAILGIFNGYCYLNASLLRLVAVRAPGTTVEQMDVSFFGEGAVPPYQPRSQDKNLWCTVKLVISVLKILKGAYATFTPEVEEIANKSVENLPSLNATDEILWRSIRDNTDGFRRIFYLHISCSFAASIVLDVLVDLCRKAGQEDRAIELMGAIVGDDLASAQPSHHLWQLGRIARETPAVNAAFESGVDGLQEKLAELPEAAEFTTKFVQFLADFGFRGPNEWELTSETWESKPEIALNAIDRMRAAGDNLNPKTVAATSRAKAHAAIDEIAASLSPGKAKKLSQTIATLADYQACREACKTANIKQLNTSRRLYFELARRATQRGGPADLRKPAMLTPDEFEQFLVDPAAFTDLIEERWADMEVMRDSEPAFFLDGEIRPSVRKSEIPAATPVAGPMRGIAGSPGLARGKARVVMDPGDPRGLEPGEILIAPITDPSWTPLFVPARAVVVEVGAVLSHAVIVARELGIPCACSVKDATRLIPDGAEIEVNGNTGEVTILS